MKRFAAIILPLVLFLLSFSAAGQPLSVITEEFPPFNFTREGELTGVSTEIVREIMRRLGEESPIVVKPWARGYKRLQTEPNVLLYTTAMTEERKNQFQWVGPLYAFRLGFYAKRGSGIQIQSMDDARKVASIATYKDDFREQILLS